MRADMEVVNGIGIGDGGRMPTIERLHVEARLDEPEEPLSRAREAAAGGDDEWAEWLAQHHRGEALVVRLFVDVQVAGSAGDDIHIFNRDVWIENDPAPPRVAQQVREAIEKDYETIAEELGSRGVEIHPDELGEMHVEVTLGPDLRAALGDGPIRSELPANRATGSTPS